MDEKYNEKVRAAERIHERARRIRGRFLNHVAVIERDIAIILTEHFCTEDPRKRELFFDQVASAMNLDRKRRILVEIVRKDYPRYWDEHSDFLRDIANLQKFRNKLAHSVVDVSDAALLRPEEEGIGFIQWNQGKPITEAEFDRWDACASAVHGVLSDVRRLLPFTQVPPP